MIPRPPRRRLARRLLAANGLVIAAGFVTLGVVALLVSPALFHRHVGRAIGPVDQAVGLHLDQALSTALLLSLGIGTAAAVVAALAVSWVLSSRLARPIEDLSSTAARLASGDLAARAAPPRADDELADLTGALNDMAGSLQHTEVTRRGMLSDLAHELRTPLSTIEGYLEGLADGVVAADDQTWTTLRDATGRLRRLVDDVALVSRAEEGRLDLELAPTDLAALIDMAVAAAAKAYQRAQVGLVVQASGAVGHVVLDADRAHQVLANLLDNARRHTPPGGRVTVLVEADGDALILTVADTGEGIDGAHLPHVFERFFRADPSRKAATGSGIGLTIARAIARAHGGDLQAQSEGPGRGSQFVWRLRRAGPTTNDLSDFMRHDPAETTDR